MPHFYVIQCNCVTHLPVNTPIPSSSTDLCVCVCVCVAYGWSSSSHSVLAGQEVVRVGVLVGNGVGPVGQGTSLGPEIQAGFSGSAYTQS